MTDKKTLKQWFDTVKDTLDVTHADYADVVSFIDSRIDLLDKKAEKAKAKNAEKKDKVDELKDSIFEILDSNAGTAYTIADIMDLTDATSGKVAYRLSSLAKDGHIISAPIKVEDADGKKRTVQSYTVAVADTE